jgi:hypothetical protein
MGSGEHKLQLIKASGPDRTVSPELIWRGVDPPHVQPGDYKAVCVGVQGPQWVRAFRRWGLRVDFQLLAEDAVVSAFFNLGSDRNAPNWGRQSKYYSAWTMAHGGMPWKGLDMSPDVFTDPHLLYTVRIADSTQGSNGKPKPKALVYSIVAEILGVEGHGEWAS